jgi:hypothetical protein
MCFRFKRKTKTGSGKVALPKTYTILYVLSTQVCIAPRYAPFFRKKTNQNTNIV